MKKIISLGSLEMSLHNSNYNEWLNYLEWKVYSLPNGKKKAKSNSEKRKHLLDKLNENQIKGIFVKH